MRWLLLCLLFSLNMCANPPKVAIVLGGGGARGLAHVGVLEELEKAEIPIDLIVGCSAGGLVGALYADCSDASLIHSRFDGLKRRDLVDVNFLRGWGGLSEGKAIKRFLRRCLSHRNFEELKIPLAVVATDLQTGESVIFDEGPITPAVLASAAFPLVFQPVVFRGRTLVDGGILEPVPVSVARAKGAEVVIAVDVGFALPTVLPTNLFGVAQRSVEITYARQTELCIKDADIVIRPELGEMGIFDENHTQFAYEAGRMAARKAIPYILKRLQDED